MIGTCIPSHSSAFVQAPASLQQIGARWLAAGHGQLIVRAEEDLGQISQNKIQLLAMMAVWGSIEKELYNFPTSCHCNMSASAELSTTRYAFMRETGPSLV
ncbi:MAG: hypothetical protein Q9184_006544 [Pyrenodesmia sp. 2 TL-2023]